jgi:acyl-CoA reductase-like NAD-dependent aldehyde dehydrogenase
MNELAAQKAPTKSERRTITARDPATGEVLGEVACAAREDARDAVLKARVAQRDWAAKPIADRVRALRPLLELVIARRDELARLVSREVGKPRLEALTGEVLSTLETFRYYLDNAESILATKKIRHSLLLTTKSEYRYEPWGVVALITPWNYPFFLTLSIGLSAIVAGNAVVNKPSECTPLVGLEIEKLFRDAGLPPALWQCLPGYGDVGAALIEALPDKVSFTGSVATGRKVGAMCGERLIPVSLELGGKDPAIVLDDAPLDRAIRSLVWGSFCNAGQICASVERIYVQDRIAREFTERFVAETKKLRQGPDKAFDVDVGSMANRQQWEVVSRQVEEAKARGATVLAGGSGTKGDGEKGGWWFQPTVLSDVKDDMSVQRDETFGPVVTIVPVSGEEEAIRRANDSPYGLTASVWTLDERKADRIAKRLEHGSVYVNDTLVPGGAGEVSWGGVKHSGFGRTRGPDGLLAMARVKHVAFDRFKMKDAPFWFPYTEPKYRVVSDLIPALFERSRVVKAARLARGIWKAWRKAK